MPAAGASEGGGAQMDAFCGLLVGITSRIRAEIQVGADSADRGSRPEPPLRAGDLRVDSDLLQRGLREVARAAQQCGVVEPDRAAALNRLPLEGVSSGRLIEAWFDGAAGFDRICRALGLDVNLATLAFEAVVKPFAAEAAARLATESRKALDSHGVCPACGGLPDFAFLEGTSGRRFLVCSRCETSWPFQRIGCHSCGNLDPKTLSYSQTDDRAFRVYLCDQCGRYLKAVDFRYSSPATPLFEYRLRSWTLDRTSMQEGYVSS